MARRIIEEDVSSPSAVVEGDGSWVGRTIVSLVLIAVLVLGAIWLFNNVGDGDGVGDNRDSETNIENEGDTNIEVPGGENPEPAQS
ncbi:MAG TPA: hypothetical protein VNA14_02570 [Mycobacteriales bacterium]|nr:hypothetical protein [Mycobacteriales bacterium]